MPNAIVKLVSYEVTFHDGRDPIIFDLSTPEGIKKTKTEGFDLREGEEYKTSLKFTVEGDRISELYQTQEVFREGIRHSRGTEMLGWEEAPGGRLSHGSYTARTSFSDDEDDTKMPDFGVRYRAQAH
ncbi:E set domain-containing protein [Penicillium maclennaniae]|uniref:E set domain-containing protein n=1 Tax=Penicillium maclennaniae TaxID=1343394 RepID=UPI00254064ED|nr:E set domain-containing protein [Penicillium maclennaniae]KAJ5665984.1 E set domain-containing protein [Penicillium maclennaniae]